MGLSAWKVMLIVAVVALLFLPRIVRMGEMVKGLAGRLDPERRQDGDPDGFGLGRGMVIDGDTGRMVPPEAPAKVPLAERIGMALGRLARRITQRLST